MIIGLAGLSGTGKSTSLRYLDYKSTFILQKKMYNDYVRYNSPKSPS